MHARTDRRHFGSPIGDPRSAGEPRALVPRRARATSRLGRLAAIPVEVAFANGQRGDTPALTNGLDGAGRLLQGAMAGGEHLRFLLPVANHVGVEDDVRVEDFRR